MEYIGGDNEQQPRDFEPNIATMLLGRASFDDFEGMAARSMERQQVVVCQARTSRCSLPRLG